MPVPQRAGQLLSDSKFFIESPVTRNIQSFFREKPRGVSVLWAVEGAGKTYSLARVGKEKNHRLVYMDWILFQGEHFDEAFYSLLSMDRKHDDGSLASYLPTDTGIFTTFIFDHFDTVMRADCGACSIISGLAAESLQSDLPLFNFLVILNKAQHAQKLINSRRFGIQLYVCDRWRTRDVAEYMADDEQAVIEQSGTLMAWIAIKNRTRSPLILQLRSAQLLKEWEEGERLLAGYSV